MKIMIEKSVYNKFDDIIIAIDGDGSNYVPLSIGANFFDNGGQ